MWRPRVRFRLGTLMGVVAASALSLAGGLWVLRMRTLAGRHQQRAAAEAQEEQLYLGAAKARIVTPLEGHDWGVRPRSDNEASFGRILLNERLAEYHAALKSKYRNATSHPWMGLPPDPPPPTFETIRPDLPRYIIATMNGQEWLSLSGTDTTDADLKVIEGWTQLRKLNLCGTKVTDDGVASLRKLDRLESLDLGDTTVSEARIRELAKAMPKLMIKYGSLPHTP